jgi:zinc transport system substrate-binding protein
MNRWATIVISSFAFLVAPLGNGFAADKLSVFVSIVPQKYFVQQIGKDLVNVQVMVLPGASPATYEPKPKQMADLSKTKSILPSASRSRTPGWKKSPPPIPTCRWSIRTMVSKSSPWKAHHHHDDHDEGEHHGGSGSA